MTDDPWHFTRSELAEQTAALLFKGPARALTLFGPRRTGKTQFLLRDLGPLADKRGHRVVYASFWQAPLSPIAVLLHALEASRAKGSFPDRLRSLTSSLAPRLKLKTAAGDAEIDLSSLNGAPPADILLHLDDLLGRVANDRKPTLLMFDEVQELARNGANHELVAALRTGLDKRAPGLRAIFTGSSREGLKAMFGAREAPFFHFATHVDLPKLGPDFVAYLLKAFKRATQRDLDQVAMADAFSALHHNPYFFRMMLEVIAFEPALSPQDGLEKVRLRIADELGYRETWLSLTPIQRAVAALLAKGATKPFSKAAREEVGAYLSEAAPTSSRIQAALRKLERSGIADTYTDRWALDDPEFAAWVAEQAKL